MTGDWPDRYSIGLNPAAVSTDVARFEVAINTASKAQSPAELRQYKELERLLEEIGEEPSAPLRALAHQIEKQSGFTLPLVLPSFSASPQPLASAVTPGTPLTLTFLNESGE